MAVYTIKWPYKADAQGYSSSPNVIGHLNYQIQNGKPVPVWPAHQAEARVVRPRAKPSAGVPNFRVRLLLDVGADAHADDFVGILGR
jgi:hypothetical protein